MKAQVKRIFKPEIRSINEEERSAEFVISTESRDTYRTVFKLSGWNLERYQSNPIVTYQHDDFSSDPDMVIGTSEVRIEDNQLVAKVFFEDLENDLNEVAEKVWRKVKKGTLRMASIFANTYRGHWGERERGEDPETFYFDESELFGWSIVTHGSNPDALKRSAEEMEMVQKKENQRVSHDDFDARFFTITKKIK